MKASICLLLGVAVFSTLFLESSTASTGDDRGLGGFLGDLIGNVFGAVEKLLGPITQTVTNLENQVVTDGKNATGATKDFLTKVNTTLSNISDDLPKILSLIASGTTESLVEASDLVASLEGLIKNNVDTLAADPVGADSLKNVGASLNNLLEGLGSVKKIIDLQVEAQVSV